MSGTTRLKICGITSLADAELAVGCGAWAIGVILWPGSPRRCTPEQAELIARTLRRSAEICGVFVDEPLDEVSRTVDALGLTMAQLHGDEGPSYCEELRRRTGARVIKAARVGSLSDLRDVERFHHVDYHLLDTRREGLRGGTGEPWDWSLTAERHSKVPLVLSGGLDAENVGAAVRIVNPFAVDVASGVESSPGIKDRSRIEAFAAALAEAQPAVSAEVAP